MTAEGFMAGLVASGYRGPWRWAHHQWEHAFYGAWSEWPPVGRAPQDFPRFRLGGGAGPTSQARDMLWQLKRTSPFHEYQSDPLPEEMFGLTPVEYLEIHADAARPDEWIALADAFLREMREAG